VLLIGESLSVEHNTDLIHAAYLKHVYTHAAAHCNCNTQSSSILVSRDSGVLLASTAVVDESHQWYSMSSIKSLIYRAALRGIPCYGLDLYTPEPPTKEDAIAIRESGIHTVIYHKEFTEANDSQDEYVLDFLGENNVRVIEWSGKVSNQELNLMVQGESFNP